jgi:cyanophycinase
MTILKSVLVLLLLSATSPRTVNKVAEHDLGPTVGPASGWLVIQGGGALTNEIKDRFVALAGGPSANFVVIPTALSDREIEKSAQSDARHSSRRGRISFFGGEGY